MIIKIDRLIKSNRRTFSIEINKKAELTIRAPLRASQKEINSIVEKRADWIRNKQKLALEKTNDRPTLKFETGEKFLFLGNYYPLQISEDAKHALNMTDKVFVMKEKFIGKANYLFLMWYRMQATKIFPQRLAYYSKLTGFGFSNIKISNAKKRWGSCSSRGSINLSWRLVLAPLKVIDYVIVHELAHTKELNHSPNFWKVVHGIMPDYKIALEWLRKYEPLLDMFD
jgi:predicted metal-dependent hydrolase